MIHHDHILKNWTFCSVLIKSRFKRLSYLKEALFSEWQLYIIYSCHSGKDAPLPLFLQQGTKIRSDDSASHDSLNTLCGVGILTSFQLGNHNQITFIYIYIYIFPLACTWDIDDDFPNLPITNQDMVAKGIIYSSCYTMSSTIISFSCATLEMRNNFLAVGSYLYRVKRSASTDVRSYSVPLSEIEFENFQIWKQAVSLFLQGKKEDGKIKEGRKELVRLICVFPSPSLTEGPSVREGEGKTSVRGEG